MNILVTGATGMLGGYLADFLSRRGDNRIFGTSRKGDYTIPGVEYVLGDLTNRESYHAISSTFFNCVIHCAAETNVNLCEANPQRAIDSNVIATRLLIENLKFDRLLYVSTDSVFDGKQGDYDEQDIPKPLNQYAKTKLEGENIVRDAHPAHYILRTNMYGFKKSGGSSIFEWAYHKLNQGETLSGYRNMLFNPLYIGQLASSIEFILREGIPYGTYNLTADDNISKYDFLNLIATTFGFDRNLVLPVDYQNNDNKSAERPLNTTLKNRKIKNYLPQLDMSLLAGMNCLHAEFRNI